MRIIKKANEKKASVRAKRPENGATDMNLSKLREIVRVLETSTLAELRYEDQEIAVEVRRYGQPAPSSGPAHGNHASAIEVRSVAPAAAPPAIEADVHVVRSPFV